MTRSRVQCVVVATTILITLKLIVAHWIRQNTFDNYIWGNPGVKNFTETLASNEYRCTGPNCSFRNKGAGKPFPSHFPVEEGPFYAGILPRTVFIYALLVPLQYYWNVQLDQWWPTRPRAVYIGSQKPQGEDNNDEKETIKRFIAEGRVRRPSVSTWHVFVKWVIDINAGSIIFEILRHILDAVVPNFGLSPRKNGLAWNVMAAWGGTLFSMRPLISLVGFIIVPAHKRVPLGAGIDLLQTIFMGVFWRLAASSIVSHELVQGGMKTAADFAKQQAQAQAAQRGHHAPPFQRVQPAVVAEIGGL